MFIIVCIIYINNIYIYSCISGKTKEELNKKISWLKLNVSDDLFFLFIYMCIYREKSVYSIYLLFFVFVSKNAMIIRVIY